MSPWINANDDADDEWEDKKKLNKFFFDGSFSLKSLQNKAIEFSPNLSNQKWEFWAAPL